jgi:hypothetical protein
VERGVARGDVDATTDPELALDLLSGPLLYRFLIMGRRIDDRFVRAVVTAMLRACGPHP